MRIGQVVAWGDLVVEMCDKFGLELTDEQIGECVTKVGGGAPGKNAIRSWGASKQGSRDRPQ